MKAGVITFQNANNYGALLQAYALQTAIKKSGCKAEIIDYMSGYIEKPYSIRHLKIKGVKTYIIGLIGYICYLPRRKKCNNFRKYLSYSRKVDADSIEQMNSEYDIFITGSDQVWNYKLTGKDMNFLLKFVHENEKKFSYAASIGLDEIEQCVRNEYKELLAGFQEISLRERRAKEIVYELCGKTGQVVVDPTLLLTRQDWERVIVSPQRKKGYIAVYQLGISKRFTEFVRKTARDKHLKVWYIPFPLGGFVKGKWDITVGPSEWLGIVKNADYVVTDSYHGVIFSLLFHRKFIVEVNERNKNVGSRIYDLLEKVDLNSRLLNNTDVQDIGADICFAKVDEVLERERKLSREYLNKIINS